MHESRGGGAAGEGWEDDDGGVEEVQHGFMELLGPSLILISSMRL